MSGELTPKQQRAMQEAHIADLKNRSIIPALEAMAADMERRAESGELEKELKGMKAASLIHNLTKIIAAIKTSAVIIAPPGTGQSPARDVTRLRAQSATGLSEHERAKRRKAAEQAVEAEVVEEDEDEE